MFNFGLWIGVLQSLLGAGVIWISIEEYEIPPPRGIITGSLTAVWGLYLMQKYSLI